LNHIRVIVTSTSQHHKGPLSAAAAINPLQVVTIVVVGYLTPPIQQEQKQQRQRSNSSRYHTQDV
jgi:hypothetical protein